MIIAALRQRGPMTRRRLAEETGLSRSTVSSALRSLAADGSVRESPSQPGGSRGRPSAQVRVNGSRADLVGIELGRAHLAVAVADAADVVIGQGNHDIDTTADIRDSARAALDLLDRIAAENELDLAGVRGVAVGTPGPKFAASGRHSPDLALARFAHDRVQVAELMSERFALQVQVDNNTRYTALGEASSGAGAGAADVAYLRLDEGVGGGVTIDGSLLSGHWGTAGEFGHVSVDADGPRCACGGRGCVELVASLPALLTATGTANVAELTELLLADPDSAALTRAARASALALAGALAVLDVSVIVVGGRVARLPGFLPLLERTVRDVAPSWCAAELSVRAAYDDQGAGARGALVRARATVEARVDGTKFRTIG
jgi:predicted NBD/HSP70 family sugar kinase